MSSRQVRVVLDRLHDHGVEVTRDPSGASTRGGVGRPRFRGRHARGRRLRASAAGAHPPPAERREGCTPGEELVEDRPERPGVGCHRDRLPAQELGRGVLGRERARARGAVLVGVRVLADEPRDSEVQQLHLAGGRHQDVGGLEVEVQHEVAVRVGDRVAYVEEEREPRPHVEGVLVAPAGERHAVHELHGEPRPAVVEHATVDQARDSRVVEAREDPPFRQELGAQRLVREPDLHHLERHLLFELAVGALCEIDHPHPAVPHLVRGAERADEPPDQLGPRRGSDVEEEDGPPFHRGVEHRAPVPLRLQELVDGRPQGRVVRAQAVERGRALAGRKVDDRIQDGLDPAPFPGCPPGAGHGRPRR